MHKHLYRKLRPWECTWVSIMGIRSICQVRKVFIVISNIYTVHRETKQWGCSVPPGTKSMNGNSTKPQECMQDRTTQSAKCVRVQENTSSNTVLHHTVHPTGAVTALVCMSIVIQILYLSFWVKCAKNANEVEMCKMCQSWDTNTVK